MNLDGLHVTERWGPLIIDLTRMEKQNLSEQ